MNVEEYLKKNCSLHVLGLLGQNPDDRITSKDFRYIITLIEQIISERDKEILKKFVDYLIIPTEYPDTGITANKITYDGIKWRFEKFLQTLNK